MSLAVILIGLVAAFLALRFIAGMVKFAVIAAILIGIAYFVMQGGAG